MSILFLKSETEHGTWTEELGANKAVDKYYGSKYNKELTDGCHAFLEKTIPDGKGRVDKVVQTLY